MTPLLLAVDLDRTVLPNGEQPESPQARPRLHRIAQRHETVLAYISGRSKKMQQEAITEYDIPVPDYAIGDVGTSIFEVGEAASWQPLETWHHEIAPDWNGLAWTDVVALFEKEPEIRLQQDSPDQQNTFKVSYYTSESISKEPLLARMQERANQAGIKVSLIFSIDEAKHVGLLDVLPQSATKLHALQFLRQRLTIPESRTVFCGDSGNDIPALTSGLQAVMVKNTRAEVQAEVHAIATEKGIREQIYTATGDFYGMNGNYSAGVLEGLAHFIPEATVWMDS